LAVDRADVGVPLNVVYDLPSRLADRLSVGQLDVALIPIVELLRGGATLVSNACIACRGPVMSVKLLFRTRPEQVARLALDEGSRTSAALARILLAERHGARPRVECLPIGATVGDTDADAVLLIGDRALEPVVGSFQLMWDLGDEWVRWTGLPFVFAAWAARPGVESSGIDVDRVAGELEAARDRGVASLAAIAAVAAS
jgi:chorismate dehydratase